MQHVRSVCPLNTGNIVIKFTTFCAKSNKLNYIRYIFPKYEDTNESSLDNLLGSRNTGYGRIQNMNNSGLILISPNPSLFTFPFTYEQIANI